MGSGRKRKCWFWQKRSYAFIVFKISSPLSAVSGSSPLPVEWCSPQPPVSSENGSQAGRGACLRKSSVLPCSLQTL